MRPPGACRGLPTARPAAHAEVVRDPVITMKPAIRRGMRTLFLDFDGVLHAANGPAFTHAPLLADVLRGHAVQIVITSSWRINQAMVDMVARLGPLACPVVDTTPVIGNGSDRQREIECWRDGHYAEDFRVLDDDARLFEPGWPPLILCDGSTGLNQPAIDMLRAWLKQPIGDLLR